MDCNKDEAVRAKEIAEKKFTEKDIAGAKRFASKAQYLYPGLEGLSQFQEVLDVYSSVERKVNGEVDWYKVLDVDPSADDETIRKKYRKLALAVHPDKNKSAGAAGAFAIISEAWTLLSDKVKKAVYDQKMNVRATYNKFTGLNPGVSVRTNGRYDFTSSSTAARNTSAPSNPWTAFTPSMSKCDTKFSSPATSARNASASSNPPTDSTPTRSNGSTRFTSSSTAAKNFSAPCKPQVDSTPHKSNGNTFWTLCKRCMTKYEFVSIYRNKNLLCPDCRLPFLAIEIPPPPPKRNMSRNSYRKKKSGIPSSNASSDLRTNFTSNSKRGTTRFSPHSKNRENVPLESFFKSGGSRSMASPTMDAAQSMHGSPSTGDCRKRGHEESFPGAGNLEDVGKKSSY